MKKLFILLILLIVSIGAKAQKAEGGKIELKRWNIKSSKDLISKSKFSYTNNKVVQKFYLELKGNNLLLKEVLTNKVVDKYKGIVPNLPDTGFSCEIQYKLQDDAFMLNTYPKLIALANKNCSPVRYCIQYYCDGRATLAVMYMIVPNSPRCKWLEAMTQQEMRNYKF